MNTWRKTVINMTALRDEYIKKRTSEPISVHRTLILRGLALLYEQIQEAKEFFEPIKPLLIENVTLPDRSGDYEKGAGRHYYCAANFIGIRLRPSNGYYKNGVGRFGKSARTMLEEDYTMALTMQKANFPEQAAIYLARAVHMVSDICCLPHATQMTYFSPKKKVHKAYEALARAMYPDSIPAQTPDPDAIRLFECRECFGEALNFLAEEQIDEPKLLANSPAKLIINRIYAAECAVAAILKRFYEDLSLTPKECGCLCSGAKLIPMGNMPPLTAKITADGIRFTADTNTDHLEFYKFMCSGLFRIAHRHGGYFTLSPVNDPKGSCVVCGKNILRRFSPRNKRLFFTAEC